MADSKHLHDPDDIQRAYPDLPVPRLEFVLEPYGGPGEKVGTRVCRYQLVRRNLAGRLATLNMGCSHSIEGDGMLLGNRGGGIRLPYWYGDSARHDASHLRLPLYAITADHAVRLDAEGDSHA